MVDIQLKCTSSPNTTAAGYTYQLDTQTYDKLRDKTRSAPGYLGLMIAPSDPTDWVAHDEEHLVLSCHAYWAQIQDRTDAAAGSSKAITLPTKNQLNGLALDQMFALSYEMVTRTVTP